MEKPQPFLLLQSRADVVDHPRMPMEGEQA